MANAKKSAARAVFNIVVGIDYTATGDAALAEAIAIAARRPGARLHVVHGLDAALRGKSGSDLKKLDALLDKGATKMKAHLASARRSPALAGHDVVAHVRFSAPADAIVQLAVDIDADLVVVGTSPRKGIAKLVHSSVSSKVLKHTECAVLLVRRKNHAGMPKTPRIEAPCARCKAIRAATGATTWLCERHAKLHAARRPHVYNYHRHFALRGEAPAGGA